jgi:hypothetical protein
VPEVRLSPADRTALRDELANIYSDQERLYDVLADIGYPPADLPSGQSVRNLWSRVVDNLNNGADPGLAYLMDYVLSPGTNRYPRNDVLRHIAGLLNPDPRPGQPDRAPSQPGPLTSPFVQLFVQAESEVEREKLMALLRDRGLNPRLADATNVVTRFELGANDAAAARRAMDGITRADDTPLSWTVVPPGGPAYLLSHLIVEGPDGRPFLFTDIPAATTVADVAADALDEYPREAPGDTPRHAVADRVAANGQGERLNPEQNLHEAGIRDGDRVRVGVQANAGAINPAYRDEALARAGNQIEAFVDNHPGIGLEANAPDMATWYELQFVMPSFGPPRDLNLTVKDLEPTLIDEHVVQIELGPDYPLTPPDVYWLTEIFHPNVWPNYESEKFRLHPPMRGRVCLGELAEAYEPALDLGRLCQTLLDIAGYKNYSTVVRTGGVIIGADGMPLPAFRNNTYDEVAGTWARTRAGLAAIEAIHGTPEFAFEARAGRSYRNRVDPYRP